MQQIKIQKKTTTNSHPIFCWLPIKHGGGGGGGAGELACLPSLKPYAICDSYQNENWYSLSDPRNKTQVVPTVVRQTFDPLVTSPGALPLSYKRLAGANVRFTH